MNKHFKYMDPAIVVILFVIFILFILFPRITVRGNIPLETIMSMDLTYINEAFNISCSHTESINCINASDPEHKKLKLALKSAITKSTPSLKDSLVKNAHILTKRTEIQNGDLLEKYMKSVWGEFLFGSPASATASAPATAQQFESVHSKISTYLEKTFHNNPYKQFPILGKLSCYLLRRKHQDELNIINAELDNLIRSATDVVTPNLCNQLINYSSFSLRETMFLAVLTYDFVYNALYHWLLISPGMNESCLNEAIRKGFLYPKRMRHDPKTGTYYVVDLIEEEEYFSAGKRYCLGQMLFKRTIIGALKSIITGQGMYLTRKDTNTIIVKSENIPLVVSNHTLLWNFEDSYLKTHIYRGKLGDINEYVHLTQIDKNYTLRAYIIRKLLSGIPEIPSDTAIVCPEVRGLTHARALADELQLPLCIVRKAGKTPGPQSEIRRQSYDCGTGKGKCLEVRKEDTQYRNIIIVDDGIASGGTALACRKLYKESNLHAIVVVIKHTYCELTPELCNVPIISAF